MKRGSFDELEEFGLDIRLTTRQAAAYLGLSPQRLRNLRHLHQGPRYERVGKTRVLYWKRDLDQWDANRRQTAGSFGGPLFPRDGTAGQNGAALEPVEDR